MTPPELDAFFTLVTEKTGLVTQPEDRITLQEKIRQRMTSLHLSSLTHYTTLLKCDDITSRKEWRELVLLLTTGESYFFRDSGQITLLRTRILPELIQSRQHDRTLNIWSAGCSTGEEPYTLAIILDQLLPFWDEWQVTILGTDINEASLEKACSGHYSPWSFRKVPPAIINRFFNKEKSGDYTLETRIRQMVTFKKMNLIEDALPDPLLSTMGLDLIVCRNVFIYFDQETVQKLVGKFSGYLRPNGYLMTGHAELSTKEPAGLLSRIHPESVIYQKPSGILSSAVPNAFQESTPSPTITTTSLPSKIDQPSHSTRRNVTPPTSPFIPPFQEMTRKPRALGDTPSIASIKSPASSVDKLPTLSPQGDHSSRDDHGNSDTSLPLEEMKTAFSKQDHRAVIQHGEIVTTTDLSPSDQFDYWYLLARSHANVGQRQHALDACEEARALQEFHAGPLFLIACIRLESDGHRDSDTVKQVEKLLNQVLYLDSDHIPAYLELAAIHQQRGDDKRARKYRTTARDILTSMDPKARVEGFEEWSVQELMSQVDTLL
ncbi:MAG: protein-glutamate O-methyltransferase CheR [Magnetococcales bacterium]|nr:protein-glutamate O-methyltransferase CheR [Magnetococcales bacterium]